MHTKFLQVSVIALVCFLSGSHCLDKETSQYVALAQALKYGDKCSWEAEEFRQSITKEQISGKQDSQRKLMETVVKKGYKLCSPEENFVCDKKTTKCVCGDTVREALFGPDPKVFFLEGTNKCRYNAGSYCVSEEMKEGEKSRGFIIDSKCKSGTTCKTPKGDPCHSKEALAFMKEKFGKDFSNPKLMAKHIFSGDFCTCRA